jgi:CDP-paratose 2-epimerase
MNSTRPLSALRHRAILITGGCGFIGCNLANALAERGRSVIVFDSLEREGSRENALWLKSRHGERVEIKQGDVRDIDATRSQVKRAAAVLHLAGQVAVTTSLDHPIDDFEINARGTLNVLEAVREESHEMPVVFASTNKVYGRVLGQDEVRREDRRYVPVQDQHRHGISENFALDFHSPYGCSKGTADQYVHDYARVYGLRAVVLRMSCIYGPRQFGTEDQGWIAHFFLQSLRAREITIYGDGYQVRDALHVDDAVAAWLAVLDQIESSRGEIFNLGGGPDNSLSLRELLDLMSRMDRDPLRVSYCGWRAGDQPWYVSDTSKLRHRTGWSPRVHLADGLRSLDGWLASRFAVQPQSWMLAEARP